MKFLKELSRRFLKNKLVTGSLVVMIGAVVGGFGNYLYHLLMGRMLGPADYGLLVSLISLLSILSIPLGAIGLTIVKFVSAFKGKKDLDAISFLFKKVNLWVLPFSLLLLLFFLIFAPLINSFLRLNSFLPLTILLIIILIGIFSSINKSFLQGLLRFGWLTASGTIEITVKLLAAVILVTIGLKVNGALGSLVFSGLIALLISFWPLRFLWQSKQNNLKIGGREILTFSIPVFFLTLSFTSLYSSDIILARHFLSGQETGFYAALSTMGKIIFFLAGPIITVMFPMISERHANGIKYKNLLLLSLGLVGMISFGGIIFYFLWPSFIIKIFYGSQYLSVASYLGLFAVFFSFYSLSYLLLNFYVSIKKTKIVILPVLAAIFQIIFIFLFHQNLLTITLISVVINALLFFSLLLYLIKYKNEK
jgi:O-antigen/teichoic acid export membrane protein